MRKEDWQAVERERERASSSADIASMRGIYDFVDFVNWDDSRVLYEKILKLWDWEFEVCNVLLKMRDKSKVDIYDNEDFYL